MTNSNIRYKRDYEDLDRNCTPLPPDNIESHFRDYLSLGEQPTFRQSDSAIIIVSSKTVDRTQSQMRNLNTQNNGLSVSIPCFLRRSTSAINDPSIDRVTIKKCENPSRYSLKRKENLWLFSFICFYVAYMIAGSFCIKLIETPIEQSFRKNYTEMRDNILKKYPQISEDLKEFVELVLAADDIGVYILEDFQNATNWNFGQSLFFSTSLVTTIGYGHITPKSQAGRLFCIIFSAIGIPLTLLLFSVMVERLLTPTNYLLKKLLNKLRYRTTIFGVRLIHLFIVVSLVFILIFLIPMIILVNLEENWTYFDAFYFCFISLTTIGLGDFVPGNIAQSEYDSLYKVVFSIYMVVGLIAMMLVLTVFYSISQLNVGILCTTGKWPKQSQEVPNTKISEGLQEKK